MTPRWKRLTLAGLALAGVLGFAVLTRAHFAGAANALAIDLNRPDILVRSARLSDLPRDLVQAPLLRGVLTDEVVHYYQDHPTRLSLMGTLKRLAFEHDLSWSDRLVATLMDAPGELSLWRDAKGRPEYFMLVLQQNLATQIAQQLAKLSLSDKQLSVLDTIQGAHGDARVYVLQFDRHHQWAFVAEGDRLVVLSDLGMLLDGSQMTRATRQALSEALRGAAAAKSGEPAVSVQARSLGLGPFQGARQDISARADYLSFGYQMFFPGLDALRVVESQAGGWQLSARLNASALQAWQEGSRRLWQTVPAGHAVCVALPMAWQPGTAVLKSVVKPDTLKLFDQLDPVAGLCWNRGGGFDAPMLAARLRNPARPADDQAVAALVAGVTRKRAGPGSGAPQGAPVAPVSSQALAGGQGRLWLRKVPHGFGNVTEKQTHLHKVSALRLGQTLMASIDQDTLAQAQAVAKRSYPAMADQFQDGEVPVMVVDSALLAQVIDMETFGVLSADTAPTFNRVARQLLPARLKALRELGRWQVNLPATSALRPQGGDGPDAKLGWVDLTVRSAR
ncbi:MAG: hypothetical protein RI907_1176 [Pseudomonadota bacterium]